MAHSIRPFARCLAGIQRPFAALAVGMMAIALPVAAQDAPTVPPATLAQATPGNALIAPTYILGPGDQIGITVYDYEELTLEKAVLSDGTILMPLLNSVQVAGLTPNQLTQLLERELNRYLVDPDVSVSLLALRPLEVTVAGEVQRPGPLRLRGLLDANQNNATEVTPTLSTALVQAGGVTRYGDIRNIVLRRYSPNGASEPIVIDLWEAISTGSNAPDMVLQDGDSIFIPRVTDDSIDPRLVARSSLAPEVVRVRVVGQVVNPGEVLVTPNSSVSSAVAIAGGPTADANLRRVAFVRMNEQGEVERYDVDLRNLIDDFQVQEGDVVIVPQNRGLNLLDLAIRILAPVNGIFNVIDTINGLGNNNNN